MDNETSEEVVDMNVFKEKVTQDINDIRQGHNRIDADTSRMKDDIRDLQISDKLQDQEISGIKLSLSDIKEDTTWIRRKFTGGFITAAITAVVGGLIGIAIMFIYG